ncbi:MAG: glycosyltransferase family 1 protein [Ectothiorhodospiraceae bacterium]|nr:glycosyltransferase family 1 protein [Chromatiales bacterium]MCP5153863.1 glycosyltransferase family 1 protein [Ectothiorhodospiraceae bacterium]
MTEAMGPLLITGCGTLGDHLPLVALARGLRERGMRAVLAFNPAMIALARDAGLEARAHGDAYGEDAARAAAATYDHWQRPFAQAPTDPELAPVIADDARALAGVLRESGAVALLAPAQDPSGRMAAELAGVPWLGAVLMAAQLCTDDDAPRDAPSRAVDARTARVFDHARRSLGLPALGTDDVLAHLVAPQAMLAVSPAFHRPDPVRFPGIEATGPWLAPPPGAGSWRPPPALSAFMRRDPAPLVLTFSSLPLASPAAVLERYARAARRAGRSLLVVAGWAGFEPGMLAGAGDDSVMVEPFAPHDWLFERAGAVITHGGMGTLTRALRAGRPVLVEPYGNDQIFNALRVVQLGVGAAVHPHRATAEGCARVLTERVLRPECTAAAKAMAAAMREEDGVARATEWLSRRVSTCSAGG